MHYGSKQSANMQKFKQGFASHHQNPGAPASV